MDITDFEWKDPELLAEIIALKTAGADESKIYNFVRERKLEIIESFCKFVTDEER